MIIACIEFHGASGPRVWALPSNKAMPTGRYKFEDEDMYIEVKTKILFWTTTDWWHERFIHFHDISEVFECKRT